jgi:anthranilate/para-aminobenzoate synthase component II
VILSPGPGRPDRESDFGFNSKLIQESNIPILGVCLGHQGIGTSFGAKIIHAPNIKHGQVSQISHRNTGVLKDLPQHFSGVRYNSLVLDPSSKFNPIRIIVACKISQGLDKRKTDMHLTMSSSFWWH